MAGIMFLALTPGVWAYPLGLPVFDLWTVFVVQVFGGFWLSILGLMVVIGLILMFGGVSYFTLFVYELVFLISMTIGFGYNMITIPLFALIVFWSVTQVARLINSSNY